MRLFQAAYRLHKRDESVERLHGDLLTGKVVRLGRDMVLGSVSGPAFEAEISTPQGEGRVHFLLTRQAEVADEALESGNTSLLSDDPNAGRDRAVCPRRSQEQRRLRQLMPLRRRPPPWNALLPLWLRPRRFDHGRRGHGRRFRAA